RRPNLGADQRTHLRRGEVVRESHHGGQIAASQISGLSTRVTAIARHRASVLHLESDLALVARAVPSFALPHVSWLLQSAHEQSESGSAEFASPPPELCWSPFPVPQDSRPRTTGDVIFWNHGHLSQIVGLSS